MGAVCPAAGEKRGKSCFGDYNKQEIKDTVWEPDFCGKNAENGPCRGIYIKGPGMIFRWNPRKYVTEVQIPVNK